MNPPRRSFLKLFGAAALSVPAQAFAQPIRILPDGDAVKPAPIAGQTSPDLQRMLTWIAPGPTTSQGALSTIWLEASEGSRRTAVEVLTLDEARAASALVVTEQPRASVPELIADNRGKAYVLLLAGEILIGGKQNRVLREDLLLPPLSGPRNIGVYCVEQGRWNEGRKGFESPSSVVQPSVRSEVIGKAPQSRIWSGVAAASRDLRAPSPTGSYQAIYERPEVRAHLDNAIRRLDPAGLPRAVGAAVFVGSQLAGIDCFDSPGLFAREWPKLLRAYALDAYGGASGWNETAGRRHVESLLQATARVEGSLRGNAGVGQLFEFGVRHSRGTALVFERAVIHLTIL